MSVSAQTLKKSEEIVEKKGSFDESFCIPIRNGEGKFDLDKRTCYHCVKGCFAINEPTEGTWHVVGYDDKRKVFDRDNIKAGERISFGPYKTDKCLHLHVKFYWSRKENTTLKGHVRCKYAPREDLKL